MSSVFLKIFRFIASVQFELTNDLLFDDGEVTMENQNKNKYYLLFLISLNFL